MHPDFGCENILEYPNLDHLKGTYKYFNETSVFYTEGTSPVHLVNKIHVYYRLKYNHFTILSFFIIQHMFYIHYLKKAIRAIEFGKI